MTNNNEKTVMTNNETTIQIDSKKYEKLLEETRQLKFENELLDAFESERDIAIARANFYLLENKNLKMKNKNLEDALILLKRLFGLQLYNDSNFLLTSIERESGSDYSIELTKEEHELLKIVLAKETHIGFNDNSTTNSIILKSKTHLENMANSKGVNPFTGAIEPNWKLFPEAIKAIYEDLEILEKITKK